MPDQTPSPTPTATEIVWQKVVGDRLEELVFGFLDAMGAQQLVWRSGSSEGVSASDGGRDLEASFDRPTPDGEVERTRWWVEVKGRSATVPKAEVQAAIVNAANRSDIDVFIFCTNSRFSNPTRDWVEEWSRSHARPKIQLWDRDKLSTLARRYPVVAARTMPEALSDDERLTLLLERFHDLGETPTEVDLVYFWGHNESVARHPKRIGAIAMFVYTDLQDGLTERPWTSLLQKNSVDLINTLLEATVRLPRLYILDLARPLQNSRMVEASAHLLAATIDQLPAELVYAAFRNPGELFDLDSLPGYRDAEFALKWEQGIVTPIWTRLQNELEDVCTKDCARVSSDPSAFPPEMAGSRYWDRFHTPQLVRPNRIIIEYHQIGCAVGLKLDEDANTCPLVKEPELTLRRIEELQKIIRFRRKNPDGQYARFTGDVDRTLDLLSRSRRPNEGANDDQDLRVRRLFDGLI